MSDACRPGHAIRALELFSCAGGMAEGFRRAGIGFAWAVDRDPDACDSYAANLGERPLQLDVDDLLRMVRSGWSPGQFDLVVADPPCTPWSVAGKGLGLDDERDCLRATVELIALLRPRAYLIGNVPGLDHEPNRPALRKVLAPLGAAGYCIGDYARLDAADYGVPQRRRRPFWFGHLDGPCLVWPNPTHCDPRKLGLEVGLRPWATCRDALDHLPVAELGTPVRLRWKGDPDHRLSTPDEPTRDSSLLVHPRHPICELDAPARTITARNRGGQSSSVLAMQGGHRPSGPDEPAHAVTTKDCARDATLTWPWERPATTVTARDRIGAPGHHKRGGQFGQDAIKLSERARAILQGFPDGWAFVGRTKRSRSRQIGMAMPPPLAEAVARSVIRQLEAAP